MKVIGLTGPSGSGKGFCCELLQSLGIPAIDTDAVYHSLVDAPSPCTEALAKAFGSHILRSDGSLDRTILAAMVFAPGQNDLRERLNAISHGFVRERTEALLKEYQKEGVSAVVVDAPLLFEAQFDTLCDFSVTVLAPIALRRQRIIARDHLTEEAATARISSQNPDEYYTSRSKYTVYNNVSVEKTKEQLKRLLVAEGIVFS